MTDNPLSTVDMFSDGKPAPGLVPVRNTDLDTLPIDEQAAIVKAREFSRIDYVFFRRFADGRSSQVAAYVVDNADADLDEGALAQLHLQVWLHGATPLLYVSWSSRIDILSCARGADFWPDNADDCCYKPVSAHPVEVAGAVNQELRRFSALRLADGTFWDDPRNGDLADHLKTAHQMLIDAVVEADKDLEGEKNPILRRLLLLMVLVKYLEDRRVFPGNIFETFHPGATSFLDVLNGGDPVEVSLLLQVLEKKFDGDVFSLPEEEVLTAEVLRRFADLVAGQTLKRQRFLWRQFSFEHLPVEIISHLYQRFVRSGHGTVYTPPFLASLLLDHAMPYNDLTGDERILDPACGSGVFLVGALRRLVNVWRSRNGWQSPDATTLRNMLQQSIFGVEVEPYAIDLTSFSLSLALCDALQPNVIWQNLKFGPIRGCNLLKSDFFELLKDSLEGKATILDSGFDIVIGNPPFESKLSPAAEYIDRISRRRCRERGSVPDSQLGYLFLEQAFSVLRDTGRLCLIQPHGLLYNLKADTFRRIICEKHTLHTIFDFTSIRGLFNEADTKTIAVLATAKEPSRDNLINHWTFRRTVSVQERICFELDHYDRHRVPQELAQQNRLIWRINLLGGGRLLDMSERMSQMRTLAKYLASLQETSGWDYGEGFIPWRPRNPNSEESRKFKPHLAPFLMDKPLLKTDALTDRGVNDEKIGVIEDKEFKSVYTVDRYSPPLVLIKETDSLTSTFWDKDLIGYRSQIVGIHAPESEKQELHAFYNRFCERKEIYRFYCALHSTRSIVGKATSILKADVDRLPYPEHDADLSFSFWEHALCSDVLDYMLDYIRLGQNSQLLQNQVTEKHIKDYAETFVGMLGTIYDSLAVSHFHYFDGLVCMQFHFGERPHQFPLNEQLEEKLHQLVYEEEMHGSLRTVRVVRFYLENVLLLVKPDRLRYWIRSTAIRDADETLVDLRLQGY